jgi:putative transposase
MDVDLNFRNVTYTVVDLSGNLVSIGAIPFRGLSRALHLKKLAEGLQRRYPKNGGFWGGLGEPGLGGLAGQGES